MRFLPVVLAIALFAPVTVFAAEKVDIDLLSARWTYKGSLVSSKPGFPFTSAEAVLVDVSQKKCDNYNMDQRMIIRLSSTQGQELVIRSGSISTESIDGLRYTFESKTSVNGRVVETHIGSAKLDGVGKPGLARYSEPAKKEVKLPAGTIFGATYAHNLLEAAARGEKNYQALMFNGTAGEDGLTHNNSIIGAARPVSLPVAKTGREGKPDVAWPVHSAHFPNESKESEPEFESSMVTLPNGTAEYMKIDFKDFVLMFKLDKVQVLPVEVCK